jgi:Uma2 family endonuclease
MNSPATLDDLYRIDGKAELVAGEIVYFGPSGDLPATVAFEIAVRLQEFGRSTRIGKAYADGIAYALATPLVSGRQSFSPDASFYIGPPPANRMRFVEGVPVLAVEVRSENDYSPRALREMAEKRRDYFEAGTEIVWDVDPLAKTIAAYRAASPDAPVIFRAAEVADAEPILPGWRLKVAELFA